MNQYHTKIIEKQRKIIGMLTGALAATFFAWLVG
jgi:hypothetical protein